MFYLFNSAYLPTYFENVYRLAGLPPNVRVDMRYSGDNAPSVETDHVIKNKQCVICYVDRFADKEYKYYPFRKGVVRLVTRNHGRIFYTIELGGYCHVESPDEFTAILQSEAETSPRLTNSDPRCGNDGVYCVQGPEMTDLILSTEDSWSNATDQIYQSHAFSEDVPALFFAELSRNSTQPKSTKHGLRLHANTEYELHIYYKYPEARLHNGKKKICIRMGDQINREMSVGSVSDRMVLPFSLPPLDFSAGAIIIETSIEKSGSTGGEVSYTATVPFRTYAWRSNLLLFGLLFLVSFIDQFRSVDWQLLNVNAWISTMLDFLKFAVVIWAVFKYRGKLKLPGL